MADAASSFWEYLRSLIVGPPEESSNKKPPVDVYAAAKKAETIGAPKVGTRYLPTEAPWTLSDLAALMVGPARPMSVAAQDPYGILAWERGAGDLPLFMGTTEAVENAAAKVGRGLYSRVDDVVSKLPMKGAQHPNKIASQLRSGASAEELAYRGIPEFLASKGNAPVTRAELEAHLAAHPAPFPATTTLAAATPGSLEDFLKQQGMTAPTTPQAWTDLSQRFERGAQQWQRNGDPRQAERMFRLSEQAMEMAEGLDLGRGLGAGQPKYAQYQLPGGENYRESLYTLPQQASNPYEAFVAKMEHKYGTGYSSEALTAAERQAQTTLWNQMQRTPGGVTASEFTSGHWQQPNVLTHARTTERTLPTGERGLFVEEVQSDWHQQGKKKGYARDTTAELQKLSSEWEAVRRTALGAEGSERAAANARLGEITDRMNELHDLAGGVPDAPFKESWPDLALKQQLLDAAQDPKAQWLGFTSGETQAARYDLSKQISRISYEPHEAGDYSLGTLYAYDKDGKQVLRETRLEPTDLDEYIGKEPADKLRQQIASHEHEASQWTIERNPSDRMYYVVDPNGEYVGEGWGSRASAEQELTDMRMGANQWEPLSPDPEISGLDLKVGGEGMREFYDKLLPKRLEKLVKQFGGTVERAPISATDQGWIVRLTPEMKQRILKEGLPLMTIPLAALGAAGASRKPSPERQ